MYVHSHLNTSFPKRELRAVWMVTLDNKDFPTRPGLSSQEQQQELIELLDYHQKRGINAIFFQVRPAADAFYDSPYEPWSEWLSGRQGFPPQPYYDPLRFIIEECHRRNMELHAWFNPYRAVFSLRLSDISPNHIIRRKPHWFINYANHKQFDPGLPVVRNYICKVVMDVVKRYDVDGIHFDDYFYPYRQGGKDFPDDRTFQRFSGGFRNKADWRRDNVNKLIHMVHDSIQVAKPYVKFGVSPLGVWRNRTEDSRGSNTQVGQSSYDVLGADALTWLKEGWVDYIAPQLYWSLGHPRADYRELANWWARHHYGRHIYVGQALFKVNNDADSSWFEISEMPNQLRINKRYEAIQGSIFFRARDLMRNVNAIGDTLRQYFFKYPALIPTMPWKDNTPPPRPVNLRKIMTPKRLLLRWEAPTDSVHRYVLYRFQKDEPINLQDPSHIIAIQEENSYYQNHKK
ncbi:MAG: family 10 glycosylhydrolase, partial [Bacteroidota bacterium]